MNLEGSGFQVKLRSQSLQGLLQIHDLIPIGKFNDLTHYLVDLRQPLGELLSNLLVEKGAMSYWVSVRVRYRKVTLGDEQHGHDAFLHTGKRLLTTISKLEEELAIVQDILLQRNANYNRQSSSLVMDQIYETELTTIDYAPLQ